jgi:hypothetical protein
MWANQTLEVCLLASHIIHRGNSSLPSPNASVHDPASGWLRTPHPSLGLIAEAFIIFGLCHWKNNHRVQEYQGINPFPPKLQVNTPVVRIQSVKGNLEAFFATLKSSDKMYNNPANPYFSGLLDDSRDSKKGFDESKMNERAIKTEGIGL